MLTEEILDQVLEEIDEWTDADTMREVQSYQREAKELVVFVMSQTEDLSEEAQGIALETLLVLYRAFGRVRKLPQFDVEIIGEAYAKTAASLASLEGANENLLEQSALAETGEEPVAMQYVVETLMDDEDEEELLTSEEQGELFIILKTIVNLLHRATTR